jgi:hypothetical protein
MMLSGWLKKMSLEQYARPYRNKLSQSLYVGMRKDELGQPVPMFLDPRRVTKARHFRRNLLPLIGAAGTGIVCGSRVAKLVDKYGKRLSEEVISRRGLLAGAAGTALAVGCGESITEPNLPPSLPI